MKCLSGPSITDNIHICSHRVACPSAGAAGLLLGGYQAPDVLVHLGEVAEHRGAPPGGLHHVVDGVGEGPRLETAVYVPSCAPHACASLRPVIGHPEDVPQWRLRVIVES